MGVLAVRRSRKSTGLRSFFKRGKSPILVLGSGAMAKKILHLLAPQRKEIDPEINVTNFQWDMTEPTAHASEWKRLFTILRREGIKIVVIALSDRRRQLPVDLLIALRVQGVRVVEGTTFYEEISGRVPVKLLRPADLIFCDGFRRSRFSMVVKRVMDIVFSMMGLILSSPFFVVLPILIKLDSKGPVFYCQERVGWKGRLFNIIKFRTMVNHAEEHGAVWAQKDDPRVTGFGKFMRKTRLDEIPQLINILNGTMSFVGPRPERSVFVQQLQKKVPFYVLRFTVKPGLTGWAQTEYAYTSTFEESQEKFEHDLYYMKHLTALFDLKIIFSTVRVVLTGQGAR
ncbi:MAG: exopolysaccharide biosynthesis polyprenyl glycosylphosphotransferase [Nitrospirota bacterium]